MQGVGCDCALTQVQQQQQDQQLVLGGENALVVWACERASEPTNQEHKQLGPSSAPACWRSEGGCVQRGAVRAPYTNVTVDTHVHVACTGVWLSVWSVSYSIFWARVYVSRWRSGSWRHPLSLLPFFRKKGTGEELSPQTVVSQPAPSGSPFR